MQRQRAQTWGGQAEAGEGTQVPESKEPVNAAWVEGMHHEVLDGLAKIMLNSKTSPHHTDKLSGDKLSCCASRALLQQSPAPQNFHPLTGSSHVSTRV